MRTLALANGDAMPALGLGTWRAEPSAVGTAVHQALEMGYRHIDGAAIYGNEAEIGEALEQAFADGVVRREELWITSKLWSDCHAPEAVRPALERTLADLRLPSLDLYLIHWPVVLRPGVQFPQSAEDLVPLEQVPLAPTWAAMEDLQKAGLCRHIGVSNFSQAKLEALLAGARVVPSVNQVERHPYLQQPDLLAYCREKGISLTAYSPLGSGRNDKPSPVLADPLIAALAAERGVTPAQVLLAWGIACGTVVIPKALGREHLAANLAAQDLELDGEAMAQLAALDRGERLVDGSFWFMPGSPYTAANLWDGPPAQ